MCLAAGTAIKATGNSGGREPGRIIPSADTLQTPGSHISAMRTEQALMAFPLLPSPPKKEKTTQKPNKKSRARRRLYKTVLDLGQGEQDGQDASTYPALMIHPLTSSGCAVQCLKAGVLPREHQHLLHCKGSSGSSSPAPSGVSVFKKHDQTVVSEWPEH